MTPLDRGLLNSPDPGEVPGPAEAMANEVLEEEVVCDEHQSLQAKVVDLAAKMVELRELNHKLRVENVAFRGRIEQLKSKSALERKFFAILGISLWFLFLYAIVSKVLY
jgi:hypothetical protein